MEIVRVLRLIEYVGPRDLVEEIVGNSLHGTREIPKRGKGVVGVRLTGVTIGEFPEVLGKAAEAKVCYPGDPEWFNNEAK